MALLIFLQMLSLRVTPLYDKCDCFLHCFPLISVINERKRATGQKLLVDVVFQPIPSEVENPVRKQGKAGSMCAVMMNWKIKTMFIVVFNSAATTIWSEGPM